MTTHQGQSAPAKTPQTAPKTRMNRRGQTTPATAPKTAPADVFDCIAMGLPASAWRDAAASATPARPSPLDAARAVLGECPRDVLYRIDAAIEGLNWGESLFVAIDALCEQGASGNAMHIQRLAGVGSYLAGRIGIDAQEWREELQTSVDVAVQGGAA